MSKKTQPPINVAIPNTTVEKMEAIVSVAHAIENLSKALMSVQVEVNISNNTITGVDTGISIRTMDVL